MSGDERFVRRLESFSDIVIGFSLAQLGSNLVIPAHGSSLFTNPMGLVSFFFAFTIICSVWYFHHRLFSELFVPRGWPVVINFIWLAIVVLLVFSAQAYVRNSLDLVFVRLYFGCYALTYGLLALQYQICMRYRGQTFEPAARLRAERGAAYMMLWTFPFVWAFLTMVVLPWSPASGMLIGGGFIATGFGSGMLRRRYPRARASDAV